MVLNISARGCVASKECKTDNITIVLLAFVRSETILCARSKAVVYTECRER